MLIALCQLLGDGVPRSLSGLSAALPECPPAMLLPMLEQLERRGKIRRCEPALPCSKAGCRCDQLDEPWYQWSGQPSVQPATPAAAVGEIPVCPLD